MKEVKELEVDKEVLKRIEMICRFAGVSSALNIKWCQFNRHTCTLTSSMNMCRYCILLKKVLYYIRILKAMKEKSKIISMHRELMVGVN